MNESILKGRFMGWAQFIYELTKLFPKETVYFNTEKPIIKSSSSAVANYCAACRGKSRPDFINKLKIVEEELDETIYWLNYINGIDKKWGALTEAHLKEANELISIIVAPIKTCNKNYIKQSLKTKSL